MPTFGRKSSVFLSFCAIALIWLVWLFDILVQPSPFESLTPSDYELHRLFKNLQNSTWFSTSETCKDFLLAGAAERPIANAGSRPPGMFDWAGGEWVNPPEALNSTWLLQQAFLGEYGGLHEATFSITPNVSILVEWGELTDLVRPFGGRLVLKEFWKDIYMEDADLKLMLHGAFVRTGVDRRVCMTGCALRIGLPNELDCGFVLKMKYPNRPNLAISRVEGELSSQRSPGDPLHIPALRVLGPRAFTGSEYEFCSEEFLQTALNMSSSSNMDNNGNASPQDLVRYLEGPSMQTTEDSSQGPRVEYIALVTPTPAELRQIGEHGKVVVGPFSTPYYPLQEGSSPLTVELVLRFKSVVTRLTATGRTVLVSASMTASLCYYNRIPYSSFVDQQAPLSMEGIWDPASEELCMLGSQNLEIFYWKLCLKSVLRRYISIDSPLEGAVLSSPHFASLALLRAGGGDSHKLTYRYTVAAKAEELASRAISPEFEALKDTRWFHPRFPVPADVPDVCAAVENVRSALSVWSMCGAYGADGEMMDLSLNPLMVTFVESCGGPNFDVPWDAPLKVPVAGAYLRVAARFSLASMNRTQDGATVYERRPCQCHAEGVYEPFTGQLHLVVHQRQSERIDGVLVEAAASPWPLERNGGGDVEAVGDSEIYMQLQFASVDRTMFTWEEEALDPDPQYSHQDEYIHRQKVNVRVESLRSQSDPLYFKPVVAKGYPNYNPSPNIFVDRAYSWIPQPSPLNSLES